MRSFVSFDRDQFPAQMHFWLAFARFESLLPQTQNYEFRPGLPSRTKCTRCPLLLASGPLLLASAIRAIQGQCHRIHSQLSGSGLAMPLTNSIGEDAEYPKASARIASHHLSTSILAIHFRAIHLGDSSDVRVRDESIGVLASRVLVLCRNQDSCPHSRFAFAQNARNGSAIVTTHNSSSCDGGQSTRI